MTKAQFVWGRSKGTSIYIFFLLLFRFQYFFLPLSCAFYASDNLKHNESQNNFLFMQIKWGGQETTALLQVFYILCTFSNIQCIIICSYFHQKRFRERKKKKIHGAACLVIVPSSAAVADRDFRIRRMVKYFTQKGWFWNDHMNWHK